MCLTITGQSAEGEVVTWYFPRDKLDCVQVCTNKKTGLGPQCITLRLSCGMETAFWVMDTNEDFENCVDEFMYGHQKTLVIKAISWRKGTQESASINSPTMYF